MDVLLTYLECFNFCSWWVQQAEHTSTAICVKQECSVFVGEIPPKKRKNRDHLLFLKESKIGYQQEISAFTLCEKNGS